MTYSPLAGPHPRLHCQNSPLQGRQEASIKYGTGQHFTPWEQSS